MNKLAHLFKKHRDAQSMYKRISDAELSRIAISCGRDDIAAIHIKLKTFKAELAACPDWDGDTQDQIWDAIETHKRLLTLIDFLENDGKVNFR